MLPLMGEKLVWVEAILTIMQVHKHRDSDDKVTGGWRIWDSSLCIHFNSSMQITEARQMAALKSLNQVIYQWPNILLMHDSEFQ